MSLSTQIRLSKEPGRRRDASPVSASSVSSLKQLMWLETGEQDVSVKHLAAALKKINGQSNLT